MSQSFNYRHLYYFWVVAKEGGMARAAERLEALRSFMLQRSGEGALTDLEHRVLIASSSGATDRELAESLSLAPSTIIEDKPSSEVEWARRMAAFGEKKRAMGTDTRAVPRAGPV